MLERLPPESCTATAVRNAVTPEQREAMSKGPAFDGRKAQWSSLEMLLALVADGVAQLNWSFYCANVEKPKGKPPMQIIRPGVDPPVIRRPKLSQRAMIMPTDPRMFGGVLPHDYEEVVNGEGGAE